MWAVSGASRVRTITGQTSNGRAAVYSFPSSSVMVAVRTYAEIIFPSAGNYTVTASVTDHLGRTFTANAAISV